jgi:hypothetical protein
METKIKEKMSVEKAQQLLRDTGYSSSEVEQMTTELAALANILIDEYLRNKNMSMNCARSLTSTPKMPPIDQHHQR